MSKIQSALEYLAKQGDVEAQRHIETLDYRLEGNVFCDCDLQLLMHMGCVCGGMYDEH